VGQLGESGEYWKGRMESEWSDLIFGCDKTPLGRGSSTRISMSDSRQSENTINTQSTIPIYIEV
jgi:hypothetical protein